MIVNDVVCLKLKEIAESLCDIEEVFENIEDYNYLLDRVVDSKNNMNYIIKEILKIGLENGDL